MVCVSVLVCVEIYACLYCVFACLLLCLLCCCSALRIAFKGLEEIATHKSRPIIAKENEEWCAALRLRVFAFYFQFLRLLFVVVVGLNALVFDFCLCVGDRCHRNC